MSGSREIARFMPKQHLVVGSTSLRNRGRIGSESSKCFTSSMVEGFEGKRASHGVRLADCMIVGIWWHQLNIWHCLKSKKVSLLLVSPRGCKVIMISRQMEMWLSSSHHYNVDSYEARDLLVRPQSSDHLLLFPVLSIIRACLSIIICRYIKLYPSVEL